MTDKETPSASSDSDEFESWTLIKEKHSDQELEASSMDQLQNPKIGDEKACQEEEEIDKEEPSKVEEIIDDEISDGISVISDSENETKPHLELHEKLAEGLKDVSLMPLSRPLTPKEESSSTKNKDLIAAGSTSIVSRLREKIHRNQNISSVILTGILIAGLAGLFAHVSVMIREAPNGETILVHEKRISDLEMENNLLRSEMEQLKEHIKEATPPPISSASPQKRPKILNKYDDVKRKMVWAGDEDDPLLVVDKNFRLPDYCYAEQGDDLFDEHKNEFCRKKEREILNRIEKERQRPKKDNPIPVVENIIVPDEPQPPPTYDPEVGAGAGDISAYFDKLKTQIDEMIGKDSEESSTSANEASADDSPASGEAQVPPQREKPKKKLLKKKYEKFQYKEKKHFEADDDTSSSGEQPKGHFKAEGERNDARNNQEKRHKDFHDNRERSKSRERERKWDSSEEDQRKPSKRDKKRAPSPDREQNWFLERKNHREKARKTPEKDNWYLERQLERELLRNRESIGRESRR